MKKDLENQVFEEMRLMQEEIKSAASNIENRLTDMKDDEIRVKHMFVQEKNIKPEAIAFSEHSFTVDLVDGRSISVPYSWFPRLLHAQREQLQKCKLSDKGLHWTDLNEHISVAELLAGRSDQICKESSPKE